MRRRIHNNVILKKVRRLELQMSKILMQKHFFSLLFELTKPKQSHKLSGGSSSPHHPGFSTPTHSSPNWKVKYDQRHPRYNPYSYSNTGYGGLQCTAHNWINLKNQCSGKMSEFSDLHRQQHAASILRGRQILATGQSLWRNLALPPSLILDELRRNPIVLLVSQDRASPMG